MAWCEANQVDYVFGLARNERLEREIAPELALAAADAVRSGEPARRFKEFTYRTRKSWGRERRVIGKAELIGDKCQSASKTDPPSASKIDPPFGVVGGSRRSASLQRKPFVRPAGGAVETVGTPFVPTGSRSHGAQERSRDETACGARFSARPLTASSTVARPA
jgi:hypothetical protein